MNGPLSYTNNRPIKGKLIIYLTIKILTYSLIKAIDKKINHKTGFQLIYNICKRLVYWYCTVRYLILYRTYVSQQKVTDNIKQELLFFSSIIWPKTFTACMCVKKVNPKLFLFPVTCIGNRASHCTWHRRLPVVDPLFSVVIRIWDGGVFSSVLKGPSGKIYNGLRMVSSHLL